MQENDLGNYRALWASVILTALRDIQRNEGRISALNWMFSAEHGKGSMRWVCDVCNFDYEKLQRLAMSREGRRRILRTK